MQCRSLNTVSTACGASFHSDCYFVYHWLRGNCEPGEIIGAPIPAHSGATGITPSCCVLCLHRNVAMSRSKLLTSEGETHTGSVSFCSCRAHAHTHTLTDTDKHTQEQEPHVFCSTVKKTWRNNDNAWQQNEVNHEHSRHCLCFREPVSV